MAHDRTTAGMESDYASHDAYQRVIAGSAEDLVRAATERSVEACGTAEGFTVVDYGCSTNPHVDLIKAVIAVVRTRSSDARMAVVHNDLPSNNWNALLAAATDPKNGYSVGLDRPPLVLCAVGSFFNPVVPLGRASLGISFSAAHWLREQPRVAAGTWCIGDASGTAKASLDAQVAADWERFLHARALELRPGGVLVVECIGTDDTHERHVTASDLLALMREVALEFVRLGNLRQETVDEYVFPTAVRTATEARAPLESGTVAGCFEAIDISVRPVENPYLAVLQNEGAPAYASQYTGFVRAFSASTLLEHLFTPGTTGEAPETLLDAYFAIMQQWIESDPSRGVFRDWTLRVVLQRTSGAPVALT